MNRTISHCKPGNITNWGNPSVSDLAFIISRTPVLDLSSLLTKTVCKAFAIFPIKGIVPTSAFATKQAPCCYQLYDYFTYLIV